MERQVLSISQINEYIQNLMDRDALLAGVAVCGEISNYKLYPSGHHYFTLKDEGAALKCVMFKGNAMRLRFQPENGMKVIALGKISVFPRDGVYQMYCNAMTPEGAGDLAVAFEQLKAKLMEKLGHVEYRKNTFLSVFMDKMETITNADGKKEMIYCYSDVIKLKVE